MADIDFDQLGMDANELENLRGFKSLVEKMSSDPEGRAAILRFHKKQNPNMYIPEVDAAEHVIKQTEERLKPLEERLGAVTKERDEERAQRFWDGVRQKAQDAGVDFEEVQKLMSEQGIVNPDIAVGWLEKQKQPTNNEPYSWSPPISADSEEEKGLLEDPTGWGRKAAYNALNDIKR